MVDHAAPDFPPGVGPVVTDAPLVVWRTWVIRPQRLPGGDVVPRLTGLLGTPWPTVELDARCSRFDPSALPGPRGHHHRVIPNPYCTCGIYADREALVGNVAGTANATQRLYPPGEPLAGGFVELTGRILVDRRHFRAEHARIIGPLIFLTPRPALWDRVAHRDAGPHRVIAEPGRWKVRANAGPGVDWADWLRVTATALAVRYEIEVIAR